MVRVEDFIEVVEVDEAAELVQPLFDRKYRLSVPEFPLHVIAWHMAADRARTPACYIHFTDCGDIALTGGACSDNRLLRRLGDAERDALRARGGIFQYTLGWSERHLTPRFHALFGYTGDTTTERVIANLGWEATAHAHLHVRWLREPEPRHRRQMIAKAHSFGAF